MKRCPTCDRTFDDSLSFCVDDGVVLSASFPANSELPTLVGVGPHNLHPGVKTIFSVFGKKRATSLARAYLITKARMNYIEFELCLAQLESGGYIDVVGIWQPMGPDYYLTPKGMELAVALGVTKWKVNACGLSADLW